MLASQAVIDALAERIEAAFHLRRPGWRGACSTARVWEAASARLLEAHEGDPSAPLDPELFVAAQPLDRANPDPWRELTQPSAPDHYRRRVGTIVRQLRAELTAEVRRAEGLIGAGRTIVKVLCSKNQRLSPLSRYIVAQRAGRLALARRFRDDAVVQHQSCPLYRQAWEGLLPAASYPVALDAEPPASWSAPKVHAPIQPHRN